MKSQWDDDAAAQLAGPLGQRIYSSRLLGREPALVLHGGGNTSVKLSEADLFGERFDVLYVKGSGGDLASIDAAGFAPVRLDAARRLATLPALSDVAMINALRSALTDAAAPTPSVETILHAILPYPYVDHTHADALISVMNAPGGAERVAEIYGDEMMVIPYVMPGFALARAVAEIFPQRAHAGTIGVVLLGHGLFSFGQTARESYERMIALVSRAEQYLAERGAWQLPSADAEPPTSATPREIAALRHAISDEAGHPMILAVSADAEALQYARRPDLAQIATGPATPDHVIRTRMRPMLGRDVDAYAQRYRQQFAAASVSKKRTMLDAAPRLVFDPELGMAAAGRTPRAASIAADIGRQTLRIIARAALLGGYTPLPDADLLDVEYWDLEQAKLRALGAPPPLAGEVALVTGAASGIGRACVEALAARGAAVAALDIDPGVTQLSCREVLGIPCDVTSAEEIEHALSLAVRTFGGLDMLVLNAGIFPASQPIAALESQQWRRTMQVNLDANLELLRAAHPLLALAPRYGRVVVIGSKNVPAPGPGAAAYSASKAALTQLARVAALEWAADGIRVNVLHPNAVFDTAIWTDEVLARRAAAYGLSVEQYRRNNLLGVEIASADVAELVCALCGPAFAKTTGAQIPIDGGNERVI